MSSKILETSETEPSSGDVKDPLAQAQAIAERVEKLPDGPTKEKLRATLAEIWVNAGEVASAGQNEA